MAGIKDKAKVVSVNNFPTAAGLASSASGFAALTIAATKAEIAPKDHWDFRMITTIVTKEEKKVKSQVGETAEYNCLKMHATMITTKPPIIYWNPATMEIIHLVRALREEGIECYFTIDAGPNVKVMCMDKDANELKKRLEELNGVQEAIICQPGDEAQIINEHLF